jgi:hypothetical protein
MLLTSIQSFYKTIRGLLPLKRRTATPSVNFGTINIERKPCDKSNCKSNGNCNCDDSKSNTNSNIFQKLHGFRNFAKKVEKNSIFLGVKRGIQVETLPLNVREFIKIPIIRILRVIGGASVLFSLCHRYELLSFETSQYQPLLNIIYFFAFAQFAMITVISFIKVVFGIKTLLNKKELEVRNSPLNRLATFAANVAYCWKVGCQLGTSGVGLMGLSVLVDGILFNAGHEKIFEPYINNVVNKLKLGDKPVKDVYAEYAERTNSLQKESVVFEELKSTLDGSIAGIIELKEKGLLTAEQAKEINEGLEEIKNSSFDDLKTKAKTLTSDYKSEFERRFKESNK